MAGISLSDAASEEMVISALLNAKRQEIDYIFDELKAHDFYFEGYQQLFALLQGIYSQRQDLSLVSIMKLYSSQIEQIQLRRSIIEINMLYVNAVYGVDYGENDKRDMLKSSIESIKKKAAYREITKLMASVQTDMQNDGAVFDDDGLAFCLSGGGAGRMMRNGRARISIAVPSGDWSVWALDATGDRRRRVSAVWRDGRLRFAADVAADPVNATWCYELVR